MRRRTFLKGGASIAAMAAAGTAPALAQQQLQQPISARAQLVSLGRLARTHQIAPRLVRPVGDPHRREIPCLVAARQLAGVAAMGLDPLARLGRNQRRRHHLALYPEFSHLPVKRAYPQGPAS